MQGSQLLQHVYLICTLIFLIKAQNSTGSSGELTTTPMTVSITASSQTSSLQSTEETNSLLTSEKSSKTSGTDSTVASGTGSITTSSEEYSSKEDVIDPTTNSAAVPSSSSIQQSTTASLAGSTTSSLINTATGSGTVLSSSFSNEEDSTPLYSSATSTTYFSANKFTSSQPTTDNSMQSSSVFDYTTGTLDGSTGAASSVPTSFEKSTISEVTSSTESATTISITGADKSSSAADEVYSTENKIGPTTKPSVSSSSTIQQSTTASPAGSTISSLINTATSSGTVLSSSFSNEEDSTPLYSSATSTTYFSANKFTSSQPTTESNIQSSGVSDYTIAAIGGSTESDSFVSKNSGGITGSATSDPSASSITSQASPDSLPVAVTYLESSQPPSSKTTFSQTTSPRESADSSSSISTSIILASSDILTSSAPLESTGNKAYSQSSVQSPETADGTYVTSSVPSRSKVKPKSEYRITFTTIPSTPSTTSTPTSDFLSSTFSATITPSTETEITDNATPSSSSLSSTEYISQFGASPSSETSFSQKNDYASSTYDVMTKSFGSLSGTSITEETKSSAFWPVTSSTDYSPSTEDESTTTNSILSGSRSAEALSLSLQVVSTSSSSWTDISTQGTSTKSLTESTDQKTLSYTATPSSASSITVERPTSAQNTISASPTTSLQSLTSSSITEASSATETELNNDGVSSSASSQSIDVFSGSTTRAPIASGSSLSFNDFSSISTGASSSGDLYTKVTNSLQSPISTMSVAQGMSSSPTALSSYVSSYNTLATSSGITEQLSTESTSNQGLTSAFGISHSLSTLDGSSSVLAGSSYFTSPSSSRTAISNPALYSTSTNLPTTSSRSSLVRTQMNSIQSSRLMTSSEAETASQSTFVSAAISDGTKSSTSGVSTAIMGSTTSDSYQNTESIGSVSVTISGAPTYSVTNDDQNTSTDFPASTAASIGSTPYNSGLPSWLPKTIVVQSSSQPSLTSTFNPNVTETLPRLIAPPTEVSIEPDSVVITIGFKYSLNYEFLVDNPLASAQIFQFLPSVLVYPFEIEVDQKGLAMKAAHVMLDEERITTILSPMKNSLRMQSRATKSYLNISQVKVIQIVPIIISGKNYLVSLAEVYFPSAFVESLVVYVNTSSSQLYNNSDPTLFSLANLIDPSIPLIGLLDADTWPDVSVSSTATGTSQTGSYTSGSGGLGGSSSSSGFSHRIKIRFAIFLTCLVFGPLAWILIFMYLHRSMNARKAMRNATVDSEEHDQKEVVPIPDNVSEQSSSSAIPSPLIGEKGEDWENNDHNATAAQEPEILDDLYITGENTVYSTTHGLEYFVDEAGNFYYSGANLHSTSDENGTTKDEGLDDTEDINDYLYSVEQERSNLTMDHASYNTGSFEFDAEGNFVVNDPNLSEKNFSTGTDNSKTVESYNNSNLYQLAKSSPCGESNHSYKIGSFSPGHTGNHSDGSHYLGIGLTGGALYDSDAREAYNHDIHDVANLAVNADDIDEFLYQEHEEDPLDIEIDDIDDGNVADIQVDELDELDEEIYKRLSKIVSKKN